MDLGLSSVEEKIRALSDKQEEILEGKIEDRIEDMKEDDESHYLIYKVLGISEEKGWDIDVYQNVGRFLYYRAGSFLEEAAALCFKEAYPEAETVKIDNPSGGSPKTYEIDCLYGSKAVEVKWRDATTDGDHVNKEHNRVRAIANEGYKPIRVMFFYPNRDQAIRIQERLEGVYNEVGGEYHYGEDAWSYVEQETGIDLLGILQKIAKEKTG